MSERIALRMLLALSQPVNCIFWPIKTLNWLTAASKLNKYRGHVALLSGPTVRLLIRSKGRNSASIVEVIKDPIK